MKKKKSYEICPSLICLDFLNLEKQIRELERVGCKTLHIDILDGHFSPSMPLGFEAVKQLKSKTDLRMDCHVMADPPAFFIEELLDIGVWRVVFHVETAAHSDALINRIHAKGVKAGLALKPSTPLNVLEYEIEKCDAVLLMQINPGYASSADENRIMYMDRKIRDLHQMIEERSLPTEVILDGRVSLNNVIMYGKDVIQYFVGGTTMIDRDNIELSYQQCMKVTEM